MLTLKTAVGFDNCECTITVTDSTGFQPVEPEGFVEEGQPLITINDFRLSDGYLFNVLLRSAYNGKNTIVNKEEAIFSIDPNDVDPVYENNFPTKQYNLEGDGTFYLKRLFVVSRNFYESLNPSLLTGKTVVFYDEDELKFYKVVAGEEEEIQLSDLAFEFTSSYLGAFTSHKLFSICFLKRCYYLLQRQILNNSLGLNPPKNRTKKCLTGDCESSDEFISKRDFIHNTIHVLDYLIGCGYYNDAQRLLESLNTCGFICRDVGISTNNDCGCG